MIYITRVIYKIGGVHEGLPARLAYVRLLLCVNTRVVCKVRGFHEGLPTLGTRVTHPVLCLDFLTVAWVRMRTRSVFTRLTPEGIACAWSVEQIMGPSIRQGPPKLLTLHATWNVSAGGARCKCRSLLRGGGPSPWTGGTGFEGGGFERGEIFHGEDVLFTPPPSRTEDPQILAPLGMRAGE